MVGRLGLRHALPCRGRRDALVRTSLLRTSLVRTSLVSTSLVPTSLVRTTLVGPTRIVIASPVLFTLAAELGRLLTVVRPAARPALIPETADIVDVDASVEDAGVRLEIGDRRVLHVDHVAIVRRDSRDDRRGTFDVRGRHVHPSGAARAESHDG